MAQTILVVEDDAATREGLTLLLAEAGYNVRTASTVPAGLQVLAESEPDLLITDVRVSDYNGLQLIAMAPRPIPSIVVTGYPDGSIEADARRLGAEYYVKPVAPTKLLEIARRLLALGQPRKAFTNTRGKPRRPLTLPRAVRVGPHLGRILDVSATGLRFEVHAAVNDLPEALMLHVGPSFLAIPVRVAWKRHHGDRTWMCGAAIAHDGDVAWQVFLASL